MIHYAKPVQNEELHEALRLNDTDKLAKLFHQLAVNVINTPRFWNYQHSINIAEDLIQDATIRCLTKRHLFDLSKKNAYAYFYSLCYRWYLNLLATEMKHQRNRVEYTETYDET